MGGLVMMRSDPAGNACVNSAGVMVLATMGRRMPHPSIASKRRRRGCRLSSKASLYVVAVCASGSMSTHVYKATSWSALRTDSRHVAMPPHSSTRWMGLWGRMYLGMFARGSSGGFPWVKVKGVLNPPEVRWSGRSMPGRLGKVS